jgi:hypothetical protein
MVKDGVRTCDVCEEKIPKAAKYSVTVIQKRHAELFREAMLEDPAMAATFTEDEQGNVRLEICLDCKVRMGKPGETVH